MRKKIKLDMCSHLGYNSCMNKLKTIFNFLDRQPFISKFMSMWGVAMLAAGIWVGDPRAIDFGIGFLMITIGSTMLWPVFSKGRNHAE